MGGTGSGEWYRDRKKTVEELPYLPISCLNVDYFTGNDRIGFFGKRETACKGYITLWDRFGDFRQVIHVEYTKQPLGGSRAWLKCPLCQMKRTKLYFLKGEYACRECLNLTYQSSQSSNFNRSRQQVVKIQDLLQASHRGCLLELPLRPMGMHERTYHKLLKRLSYHQGLSFGYIKDVN